MTKDNDSRHGRHCVFDTHVGLDGVIDASDVAATGTKGDKGEAAR